jgi:hypothetical protein
MPKDEDPYLNSQCWVKMGKPVSGMELNIDKDSVYIHAEPNHTCVTCRFDTIILMGLILSLLTFLLQGAIPRCFASQLDFKDEAMNEKQKEFNVLLKYKDKEELWERAVLFYQDDTLPFS